MLKKLKYARKCLSCSKCMWFGQSKVCPGKVMFKKLRDKNNIKKID